MLKKNIWNFLDEHKTSYIFLSLIFMCLSLAILAVFTSFALGEKIKVVFQSIVNALGGI